MNATVRAVVIRAHGKPGDVARVEHVPLPPPGPGEARIRMLLAPINPADLNMIEGHYPIRPDFPAVPGGEGVGVIEALGESIGAADATRPQPGTRVILPMRIGTWREAANVPIQRLLQLPDGIPTEQAAMLRVNPATAFRMLRDFVPLQQGDWVLQNASNSGVGRAVIRLCRHFGFRTINVVRRADVAADLQQQGADVVLQESDDLATQIQSATGDQSIRLALNAVGGESALRLAQSLAPGGTHVTYGAMSRQPLRIPTGLLVFRDIRFRGFWVTQWLQNATLEERARMWSELFPLAKSGIVHAPVDRTYDLDDFPAALTRAQEGGRSGKVLLRLSPENPS